MSQNSSNSVLFIVSGFMVLFQRLCVEHIRAPHFCRATVIKLTVTAGHALETAGHALEKAMSLIFSRITVKL